MAKTPAKVDEETKAVAVADASYDYGADAGGGFENTKSTDLSIPFFNVLQSNSPEVTDKDLTAGDFFNTVTGEVVSGKEGLPFLAVHQEVKFVEWVPRDSGGGYVGAYDPEAKEVAAAIQANNGKRAGKLKLPNGNDLIETHYVYGLQLTAYGTASDGFGVLSCSSTKIKPKRDWFTSMYMVKGKPPIFAFRALIKSVKQKNDQGSFFNIDPQPLCADKWVGTLIPPTHPLFAEAKAFREAIVAGTAKADMSKSDTSGAAGDGEAPF